MTGLKGYVTKETLGILEKVSSDPLIDIETDWIVEITVKAVKKGMTALKENYSNKKENSRSQVREFKALVAAAAYAFTLQQKDARAIVCAHYFAMRFDAPIERIRHFRFKLQSEYQLNQQNPIDEIALLEHFYKRLDEDLAPQWMTRLILTSATDAIKVIQSMCLHVGQCKVAIALAALKVVIPFLRDSRDSMALLQIIDSIAEDHFVPLDILESRSKDILDSLKALSSSFVPKFSREGEMANNMTKALIPTILRHREVSLAFCLSSIERHVNLFKHLPKRLRNRSFRSICVIQWLSRTFPPTSILHELNCDIPPQNVIDLAFEKKSVYSVTDDLMSNDISPYLIISGSYNIENEVFAEPLEDISEDVLESQVIESISPPTKRRKNNC